MKVKYLIDKRESDSRKKQLLEKIVHAFGTKVSISGESIELDKQNEMKVVELLTKSGLKYQKAS
jgi:translation initiation factor 1 (eIF-1/SUI1)